MGNSGRMLDNGEIVLRTCGDRNQESTSVPTIANIDIAVI